MTQKRRKPEGYDDMTHAELLAEIGDNGERTNNALRAVVELHEPNEFGDCLICVVRTFFGVQVQLYPCPTIQAIEKQLK